MTSTTTTQLQNHFEKMARAKNNKFLSRQVYDECAKKHYGGVQLQIFRNEQLLEIDRG